MADQVHVVDAEQQRAAKIAGLAYLIPVAFIVTANFGLRGDLFVSGDPAATIQHISAAIGRYRLSMLFDVAYGVGLVALIAALYVVFKPVNRTLSLFAAAWKFVYAITAMIMILSFHQIARLVTTAQYVTLLSAEQMQALVKLSSQATVDEYYVGLTFWAVSATVIGWLWVKSRYIPRWLAWSGFLTAAWMTICAFAYIADPGFAKVVNLWWFDSPLAIFDIVLSFWLLIKGLQPA